MTRIATRRAMSPLTAALLISLTALASGSEDSDTLFIGGIFEATGSSTEFAAFGLMMDELEQLGGDWQLHRAEQTDASRPRHRFRYRRLVEFVASADDPLDMSRAICSLSARGAVAILGPERAASMPMVQSVTDRHELLYLTVGSAHQLRPDRVVHRHRLRDPGLSASQQRSAFGRFVLHVRPPVAPALTEFVRRADWRHLHYLHDSRDAELRLRELFEAFGETAFGLSVDIHGVHPAGGEARGLEAALKRIRDRTGSETVSKVVLDLRPQALTACLREISRHRMEGANYMYLLHGLDINEVSLSPFEFGGINISGFSVLNLTDPTLQSFRSGRWLRRAARFNATAEGNFLPLSAALMSDALKALLAALAAVKPVEPLPHLRSDACMSPTTPQFRAADLAWALKSSSFKMAGLTGQVSFNSSGYRTGYRVVIYQSGEKFPLQQVSEWSGGKIKVTHVKTGKLGKNSRYPRNNKTRVVTSILAEPFTMVRNPAEFDGTPVIGNERFEGFCVDLTRLVGDRVGFNYIIKPVGDGKYGDDSVNKTWNGMIGELYRHEADIAVAPLTITSKREKVVDFSKPYMEVGLSIMFMKPTKPVEEVFGFMKPLSKEIWMCIAFAYLSVSVVLFVVSRLSPYEWRAKADSDRLTNDFSIFNSLWFSLSAFMQQGGDISPRSLSGRIVGSVWWFFTLIIVSSYTANLAAFLTVERMATPIQSYEDLARQTKIKYGVVNSGASKDFFKESKIQDFRRMWQFMESHPEVFVNSVSDGVERVRKSNRDYAFLLESTMNEYFNHQNCDTMKVGGNLDSGKGYGIATPTGSDLRESINVAVLILKEKNDIHMLYKKWWEDRWKDKCPDGDSDDNKKSGTYNSLHLSDVQGLFFILGAGVVMGLCLSVMEFAYRCALLAKRQRRNFERVFREMLSLSIRGRQVFSGGAPEEETGDGSFDNSATRL